LTKNWVPSSLNNFVPFIDTDDDAVVTARAVLTLYRNVARKPSSPRTLVGMSDISQGCTIRNE